MMEHISCTNGIQMTLSQNSAEADSTPLTMILPYKSKQTNLLQ